MLGHDDMLSTPKLLVEGVAGSGKTLLAVQRALDSASQGLKTLFLCYNKTLAQELRHHLRVSSIDVHHFHE
jgi:superfamily I DNA and RNA helicase